MRCEEAAEFVSALYDGETIPRDAAEHIGGCEACRAQLAEYAQMGAELRCSASLNPEVEAKAGDWTNSKRAARNWWQKGWETMRIPRLVFALLTVAIVVLSFSLVIVKVRAKNQGTVLILMAKPPGGHQITCPLSLVDLKQANCEFIGPVQSFGFRIISLDGERIQLGIKVAPTSVIANEREGATGGDGMSGQKETPYWFVPGQELQVPVPGLENLVVTGQLMDHVPPLPFKPDENLDPAEGELRFVSPVLIRGKQVLADMAGASTIAKSGGVVSFYAAGDALYELSLSPLEGGVVGDVRSGRVSFSVDGQSYEFLLAMPVTRDEHVWVLRDADYKPPKRMEKHSFLAGVPLTKAPEDK